MPRRCCLTAAAPLLPRFGAVITEDGSPHGPKSFVLWNPPLNSVSKCVGSTLASPSPLRSRMACSCAFRRSQGLQRPCPPRCCCRLPTPAYRVFKTPLATRAQPQGESSEGRSGARVLKRTRPEHARGALPSLAASGPALPRTTALARKPGWLPTPPSERPPCPHAPAPTYPAGGLQAGEGSESEAQGLAAARLRSRKAAVDAELGGASLVAAGAALVAAERPAEAAQGLPVPAPPAEEPSGPRSQRRPLIRRGLAPAAAPGDAAVEEGDGGDVQARLPAGSGWKVSTGGQLPPGGSQL